MKEKVVCLSIVCLLFSGSLFAGEFYGYYTHIDSKEAFEETSRTGSYSDIAVRIGDGRLVFWRGSSYLPYWETPKGKWFLDEVVPRKGDGTERMPDRINAFSHVDLVKNEAGEVVVEWRYLPNFEGGNPPKGMHPLTFVEERFAITPSGKVERVIKQGTEKLDDWNDPLNQTVIHLQLTDDGVTTLKTVPATKSNKPQTPLKGNPVKGKPPVTPALHWSFNEGIGDQVKEDIRGTPMVVAGHKTFWKEGVSGTAIAFDGYSTGIEAKGDMLPAKLSALTCSGWLTIGAYPWNIAPIVQKGEENGFFLGIDASGKPCMYVKVGDRNEKIVFDKTLERNHWYHLAGVCDATSGKLQLFLDGQLVQDVKIQAGEIVTPNSPIKIGKVEPRPSTDIFRLTDYVSDYGHDGLIDEVSVYQKALNAEEIKALFNHYNPGKAIVESPDMPVRGLPEFKGTGTFGAHYTNLKFYETWDALFRFGPYSDVVVEFENNPSKFIFWKGTGYYPTLVNEAGHWYSNEHNETWKRSGGKGCMEPMSDKQCYSNIVRIIENTPARVVVHWRFPIKDVTHVVANYEEETGWADWSDWYYYIYPDGAASKLMKVWNGSGPRDHEFQETMVIEGPNQKPEDVIEKDPAIILSDLNGKTTPLSWAKGAPERISYRNQAIQILNLVGTYDPFTIGHIGVTPCATGNEGTDYSVFLNWNHWPVAQINSDGRAARFPDRTSSSSLTHAKFDNYISASGDKPFFSRILMEGMSNRKAADLTVLAKSWLMAPALTDAKGCRSKGYINHERAYHLVAADPKISFTIAAKDNQPIENLALVVYNWNQNETARVDLDGKPLDGSCKQGIIRDPKGRQALIVWIEHKSTKPTSITISGAKPENTAEFTADSLKGRVEKGLGMYSLKLKADVLHGVFDRKFMFECSKGMQWNSGWQIENRVHLHDLTPGTEFSFRFKVVDFYGNESDWSVELTYTTPAAPEPSILSVKDGAVFEGPAGTGAIKIQKQGAVKTVTDKGIPSFLFEKESHLVVNDGDKLKTVGEFTWMAWVKITSDGVIVSRADDTWSNGDNALYIKDGKLVYEISGVARKHTAKLPSTKTVNDDNWHHVAIRTSALGLATLFVDGKNDSRTNVGNRTQDQGIPLKVGLLTSDYPQVPAFSGQLKDLRFYPCSLTDKEIGRIYEETKIP